MENQVICGDNLSVMAGFADNTFDTVITDPPYGLRFMGKKWDYDIPSVAHFAEMLRVAKPGAILLSFGGTRTFHRIACNIEDAGWIITDCVMWIYGQGFPKATDVSKQIDYKFCREELTAKLGRTPTKAEMKAAWEHYREVVVKQKEDMFGEYEEEEKTNLHSYKSKESTSFNTHSKDFDDANIITAPASPEAALWNGWKSALKPAFEPIIVAMKPLDGTYANNALKWGVAGFWIDGGRVAINQEDADAVLRKHESFSTTFGGNIGVRKLEQHEIIANKLAQNEVIQRTITQGRFPANLIHDGSEEVLAEFPMTSPSKAANRGLQHSGRHGGIADLGWNIKDDTNSIRGHDDNGGSAARFFYCAKASKAEREMGCEGLEEIESPSTAYSALKVENQTRKDHGENKVLPTKNPHPTVKPLALMRYLVRLTKTPTGGIVLDPYGGSGTTGMACKMEGRNFVLIEQDEKYCEIARRRIAAVQPDNQASLF